MNKTILWNAISLTWRLEVVIFQNVLGSYSMPCYEPFKRLQQVIAKFIPFQFCPSTHSDKNLSANICPYWETKTVLYNLDTKTDENYLLSHPQDAPEQ